MALSDHRRWPQRTRLTLYRFGGIWRLRGRSVSHGSSRRIHLSLDSSSDGLIEPLDSSSGHDVARAIAYEPLRFSAVPWLLDWADLRAMGEPESTVLIGDSQI